MAILDIYAGNITWAAVYYLFFSGAILSHRLNTYNYAADR